METFEALKVEKDILNSYNKNCGNYFIIDKNLEGLIGNLTHIKKY